MTSMDVTSTLHGTSVVHVIKAKTPSARRLTVQRSSRG